MGSTVGFKIPFFSKPKFKEQIVIEKINKEWLKIKKTLDQLEKIASKRVAIEAKGDYNTVHHFLEEQGKTLIAYEDLYSKEIKNQNSEELKKHMETIIDYQRTHFNPEILRNEHEVLLSIKGPLQKIINEINQLISELNEDFNFLQNNAFKESQKVLELVRIFIKGLNNIKNHIKDEMLPFLGKIDVEFNNTTKKHADYFAGKTTKLINFENNIYSDVELNLKLERELTQHLIEFEALKMTTSEHCKNLEQHVNDVSNSDYSKLQSSTHKYKLPKGIKRGLLYLSVLATLVPSTLFAERLTPDETNYINKNHKVLYDAGVQSISDVGKFLYYTDQGSVPAAEKVIKLLDKESKEASVITLYDAAQKSLDKGHYAVAAKLYTEAGRDLSSLSTDARNKIISQSNSKYGTLTIDDWQSDIDNMGDYASNITDILFTKGAMQREDPTFKKYASKSAQKYPTSMSKVYQESADVNQTLAFK